jgi:hypothetical protein
VVLAKHSGTPALPVHSRDAYSAAKTRRCLRSDAPCCNAITATIACSRSEHEAAGLARDAFYLLRPDTYVALADASGAPDALDRYCADHGIRTLTASRQNAERERYPR